MMNWIKPLGNYCKSKYLNMRGKRRKNLIKTIELIIDECDFTLQTFFYAVNIVDNYLLSISNKKRAAPCLETLALTSVILAAKLENQETDIKSVLLRNSNLMISLKEVVMFEYQILKELEFDIN